MSENFFGTEEITSTCVECGKKIKSGHYHAGRGPFGICCYKKLFGTIGLIMTRSRMVFPKQKSEKNNENICPTTGQNKDCNNCLLSDGCKYKND